MNIAAILSRRGRQFDCVPSDATLFDAITMMNNKKIGSVGIMAVGESLPVGLVSQGELIAALALHGPMALTMTATMFMRQPVPLCGCDDDLGQVLQMMTMAKTRHNIVLTQAGAVAGLVSMGDLVAAALEDSRLEADVLRDLARSHLLASPA